MSIRGGWFIKDYVFIAQLRGVVTAEEYSAAANNPRTVALMDASPAQTLHFIFEVVGDDFKPPNVKAGYRSAIDSHPKNGWSVMINFTHNPVARMVASIMSQIGTAKQSYFTNSYEQAIAHLQRVDAGLPADPVIDIVWMNDYGWTQPALGR